MGKPRHSKRTIVFGKRFNGIESVDTAAGQYQHHAYRLHVSGAVGQIGDLLSEFPEQSPCQLTIADGSEGHCRPSLSVLAKRQMERLPNRLLGGLGWRFSDEVNKTIPHGLHEGFELVWLVVVRGSAIYQKEAERHASPSHFRFHARRDRHRVGVRPELIEDFGCASAPKNRSLPGQNDADFDLRLLRVVTLITF